MLLRQRSENLWVIRSRVMRELFDLQFRSIVQALVSERRRIESANKILDFGAGDSPYDTYFALINKPVRVDANHKKADFKSLNEVSGKFDLILAIEVFEHLKHPDKTLQELGEKLSPKGEIFLSVPFSARIHPDPEDYHRWTPQGLEQLFAKSGLKVQELQYRGSDLSTWLNKTLYYLFRRKERPWIFLVGIWIFPILFLAWLRVITRDSMNSTRPCEDPLGFFVRLQKS